MSESQATARLDSAKSRSRVIAVVALSAVVLIGAATSSMIVRHLMFGWILFIVGRSSELTVHGLSLGVAGATTLVFTLLLHLFSRTSRRRGGREHAPWALRGTIALVVLLFMAFTAGIALVGITHQVIWLATTDRPITDEYIYGPSHITILEMHKKNNLDYVAIAGHEFTDTFRAPIADPAGKHSWATRILPFLNYSVENLDMQKSWAHPGNRDVFRAVVPEFINPQFGNLDAARRNGWGLDHYALNSRAVESRARWTDGDSNTLVIGETVANFPAWGKPGNWRDPRLGINAAPDGFGGPSGAGAHFIMGDGSIRFISKDIDPGVLERLAK